MRAFLVLTTLLLALGVTNQAHAASVAYIDNGEVWLSSLDRAQKVRLAAPVVNTSGATEQWLDVAASDSGRIVAVRNEPGKTATLSWFKVWEPDGKSTVEGPLNALGGWALYAYPLSLDLTADGGHMVYGYSNSGFCCPINLASGTYVRPVSSSSLDPISISGQEHPTVFGNRVIAHSGSTINVQNVGSTYGSDFTPWLDVSGTGLDVRRTDVAANGKLIVLGGEQWIGGTQTVGKIAAVSIEGVDQGPMAPVDCFVPASGVAKDPSVSQDARSIAWNDGQGLKVAGAPVSAADPCEMTSPPVVISPSGEHASIGGANIAAFLPRSSVLSLSVDTVTSAAAGARTVYRVGFTTSADGAMAGGATVRVTLPAGTTAAGWQGGLVRDVTRATDVGSCGVPNAQLVITCTLFAAGLVNAGDQVLVTLRGVTNGAAGTKTLQVDTTADADPATSAPFQIVAGASVSTPTVDISTPSAASGARTRYVIGLNVSNTGGLSNEAGSQIRIELPPGTTTTDWQGSIIRDITRNVDVGLCTNPAGGLVITCNLFTNQFVNPSDQIQITLRGLTNGNAGAKTVQVSTTSDLPPVASSQFSIVAGNSVSTPTVDISTPSAASGARTRYVIGLNVSNTGGLSNEAGSQIRIELPPGTTTTDWQGSIIRDITRNVDVGLCTNPAGGLVITCNLFTNQFVNPGDQIQITLRGLTNGNAGAKAVQVSTTSDLPPVASSQFQVIGANALTGVGVTVGSTAPLARTPYVVRFTASATGGLSNEAGSQIRLVFPAGTNFGVFAGGTVHDVTRGVNVGNCGVPSGMTLLCGFFTGAFVNAGDALRLSFDAITNPPSAAPYSLTVATTSDIAPVDSGPYTDDTLAPETTITSGPTASVSSTTATFTFSSTDAGSTFQCSLDGAAFGACPLSYTGLSQGSHTFQVRATDPAGNIDGSPASQTWTVDTVAPDTSILTGPSGTVGSTSATFTFNSTEAGSTFQCSFDGAAFGTCPAGYTGLSQGSHTFQVRATDAAGNVDASPASRTWTTDTVAPDTNITAGPTGTVASTSATFTFTATEAGSTFQCAFDGAAFGTCPAGYTGLSQGSHTFQVRATDAAGNTDASPAARTWTVDTAAPDTSITAGPTGAVNSTSATFTFGSTEAGSTFQCSLDGAAFGACPAGYTGLSQGAHTFQVRATDATGNTDASPASRTWTVDTVAPDTNITAGPTGTVSSTSATFTFTATETGSTFQCALDGAAFGACPAGYTGLSQGSHTFSVRAVDAAGNVGAPATRAFMVVTPTPTATPIPTPTPTPTSTPTPVLPPQHNQTVVVKPVGGTVLVCPRSERCRPLQTGERIPIGSTVDTRKGVVELTSVSAPGAPPQSARFSAGIFRVSQRGDVTELTLTEPLAPCGTNGRSAAKKPKSRRLWGHGSGKFRTVGQYSSATVRGTRWLVQDSCAGTSTRVTEGVVSVRDNVRRKTVTVRKGASYLAKPRR